MKIQIKCISGHAPNEILEEESDRADRLVATGNYIFVNTKDIIKKKNNEEKREKDKVVKNKVIIENNNIDNDKL